MKKPKKTRERRMTRREFVGVAVTAAGAIAGAPALLRGQNLNSRLDIAFIGVGGRGQTNLSELTLVPGAPPPAAARSHRPRRKKAWRQRGH